MKAVPLFCVDKPLGLRIKADSKQKRFYQAHYNQRAILVKVKRDHLKTIKIKRGCLKSHFLIMIILSGSDNYRDEGNLGFTRFCPCFDWLNMTKPDF